MDVFSLKRIAFNYGTVLKKEWILISEDVLSVAGFWAERVDFGLRDCIFRAEFCSER